MPLSLRHAFEKIPSAKVDENKRSVEKSLPPKQAAASRRFRPARYWRILLVGFVLLIALCGFVAIAPGLIGARRTPSTATIDDGSLLTSAFETALASQLSTLQAVTPTAPNTLSPLRPATSTASMAGIPINPWVAQIPEAACIPTDIPQTGTVVQVLDGATIKVLLDADGRIYSVRFIGVRDTAPTTDKSFAERATTRNAELTDRKHATLVRDITDADSNGMLLRYVMVERVFVNYALVAGGYAVTNSSPPDTACDSAFMSAEQQAKAGGLGLWATSPNIIPLPTSP